ncbi:MAG: hypothetical protein EOP04_31665 [Proteobacteria bacterium]|nr:MAG: hypothetical protein EOP04_31665 [Pseudomonadota bacterium]
MKTSSSPMELNIPRDREGSFEPKLIEKYQPFDPDLEKKIIGMYSRSMTTRDIQSQLEEFYCTDISPTLISRINDIHSRCPDSWGSSGIGNRMVLQ